MKFKRFKAASKNDPSGVEAPASELTSELRTAIRLELESILGPYQDQLLAAIGASARNAATGSASVRTSYKVAEVATMLDKSVFTVSEWCRLGRIHATKNGQMRGRRQLWSISAEEVARYRNEGLLPIHVPARN